MTESDRLSDDAVVALARMRTAWGDTRARMHAVADTIESAGLPDSTPDAQRVTLLWAAGLVRAALAE